MRDRFKKGNLMREGYVNGLKQARRVLARIIKESAEDTSEIEFIVNKIADDYDKAQNLAFAGADYDSKAFNDNAPEVIVWIDKSRNQYEQHYIESAVYDEQSDELILELHPNAGTLKVGHLAAALSRPGCKEVTEHYTAYSLRGVTLDNDLYVEPDTEEHEITLFI